MQGGLHPGGHVLVDAIREVDRRPKRSAGPSLPVRSPGGERRWRLVSFRGDSGTFGPSSLDVGCQVPVLGTGIGDRISANL
jgi:hypothetical protein